MKKIASIFILFAVISLTGCKKEPIVKNSETNTVVTENNNTPNTAARAIVPQILTLRTYCQPNVSAPLRGKLKVSTDLMTKQNFSTNLYLYYKKRNSNKTWNAVGILGTNTAGNDFVFNIKKMGNGTFDVFFSGYSTTPDLNTQIVVRYSTIRKLVVNLPCI